jgi:hypothetical protein
VNRERLPAHLEVASLLRRVQAGGGFGTVLRKGDPERGSIVMVITSRGEHFACFERMLSLGAAGYEWQPTGPAESASSIEIADFLARRARFDEDCWALELDIAEPERFIAETTHLG